MLVKLIPTSPTDSPYYFPPLVSSSSSILLLFRFIHPTQNSHSRLPHLSMLFSSFDPPFLGLPFFYPLSPLFLFLSTLFPLMHFPSYRKFSLPPFSAIFCSPFTSPLFPTLPSSSPLLESISSFLHSCFPRECRTQ